MKIKKIKAKKSLGQNFLKSKIILDKIVDAAKLTSADCVLEIGPGKGNLTEKLLKKAGKVVAVEKDDQLISILQEKFSQEIESGKLQLIHGDILDFNPKPYTPDTKPYKLVANIPYYLTGQIFRKFLEIKKQPNLMVLLVQKEVAKRIVSKKENILSVSVKVFGKPKYIATVKKTYFQPKPKVDSAILLVDEISNKFSSEQEQEKFFVILKTGFGQKRKKLIGNLKKIYNAKDLEKVFNLCKIKENTRAEELDLEKWRCLISKL